MKQKSVVALVACDSYDEEAVDAAVQRGIELLGGISSFMKSGEKIVLKPNVLLGTNPEKCVTTHPAVFRAAGRVLKDAGAELSFGDSSGIGSCAANMKRAKLTPVAAELGISLADFDKGRTVPHPDSLLVKQFTIANGVLDADGLISLSKMKTHGLTRFTGAVKNQFGCIPGFRKGQHHAKTPDPDNFATMLVDLNTLIRPRLYIMDGIMAMEGNGPRNGTPRKMGVLLFSTDPIALDALACKLINLDPKLVPTSAPGERAGLGTFHYEEIEIVGETPEQFIAQDFDADRTPALPDSRSFFWTFLKNRITPKPVIDPGLCTKCGTCVGHCPVEPKAVNWHTGDKSRPPSYKYNRCIRCYCCQELCPEGAITLRETLISRIVFR